MYCPICGKPRRITPLDEVPYEIDYETRFVCKKHVRKKAFSACNCPGRRSVTADKPPRVIPKGKFSNALSHPYPGHEILFPDSLTGIFQKLMPLLEPLYILLAEFNRSEDHWHVDETGWMHFVQAPGKQGWHW